MKKPIDIIIENLGKVTLNFATLELMLSCFVTKLISDDSKIGAIVTSEMSFQNLLKAFDSLAQYKFEGLDEFIQIKDIIKRINIIEQERNSLTHSAYAVSDKEDEILRLKVTAKQGKGLRITNENIKEERFKKLTSEIHAITKELELLYKTIFKDDLIKYA